ncbi:MAG: helix-turn-helix domain-containing protein [Novosphingobium sp.]|nr:helix-turn-helix domain-containing protein [Novosphingobium sp.]
MAEADVMPFEATGEEHLLSRAGEKLRAARERLGIDRGEVSLRTKINERHLAAVEDSDFTALPARIYAVGFARSYAGAVGLDPGVIAAEVRRELNEQEAPANARPAYDLDLDDPAKVPSRRLAWVAAALGIALIAAGAVFWRSYFVPAVDLPAVGDDSVTSPELSPTAMISPTAESAVGEIAPVSAPAAGAPPTQPAARSAAQARVAPRTIAPAAPPASGVQSLPSPVPDRLQPLGTAPSQPEPGPPNAPVP